MEFFNTGIAFFPPLSHFLVMHLFYLDHVASMIPGKQEKMKRMHQSG